MTSITEESLITQREKLQQQLQEQRKLIAEELLPALKGDNDTYPRSATMRFLTKRPGLVASLVKEVLVLFAGVRLFKLLSALLALIKILNPDAGIQKRLPAPQNSQLYDQ